MIAIRRIEPARGDVFEQLRVPPLREPSDAQERVLGLEPGSGAIGWIVQGAARREALLDPGHGVVFQSSGDGLSDLTEVVQLTQIILQLSQLIQEAAEIGVGCDHGLQQIAQALSGEARFVGVGMIDASVQQWIAHQLKLILWLPTRITSFILAKMLASDFAREAFAGHAAVALPEFERLRDDFTALVAPVRSTPGLPG